MPSSTSTCFSSASSPTHLKADGVYDRTVFDFPNAVAAAQSLLSGGDYFALFDLEGPYFMAPLRSEPSEEVLQPADAALTPAQLRRKAMREIEAVFASALAFATAKPTPRRVPRSATRSRRSPTAGSS